MSDQSTYLAFLRGINVGGHHKVPMAGLRKEMEEIGFEKIQTLLNSGNVIFKGKKADTSRIESRIAAHLEKVFGFPVPVLVRNSEDLRELIKDDPFRDVKVTKNTRLYISFLKDEPKKQLELPWISEDKSYRILKIDNRMICSVLDLSLNSTPKAMEALEKNFSKDITTRNWNTVEKIVGKLDD